MMPKSRSYDEELIQYLQDPERAVAYLNAALEEGDAELFGLALQNVAKAKGKVIALTEGEPSAGSNLFNGELHRFLSLLKDLGLGLTSIETSKVS